MKEIEKIKAEIEQRITDNTLGAKMELIDLLSFIESLPEQEPNIRLRQYDNIIDKVYGAGNLESWEYDEAEALVLLAKNEIIEHLCASIGVKPPYKDGNEWCVLRGDDLQSGICGFGKTIQDAFVDFLKSFTSSKQPASEDLEKEEERFKIEERKWVHDMVDETFPEQDGDFISENDYRDVLKATARHFANWQKEQMLREAVEGTYSEGNWGIPCIELPAPLNAERFDEVKLIIVKEE